MVDKARYKVVRSDVDGWDVVRDGEPQALSNHATREEAEEAARLHSEEGKEIDVRTEPLDAASEDTSIGVKRTSGIFVAMVVAVIALIAIVALIAALTDFGA